MRRRKPAPDNVPHMHVYETLVRAGLRNTLVRTSDGSDGEPLGMVVATIYGYDPARDPSLQTLGKLLPGVAFEIIYETIPKGAIWMRSGRLDPWDPREVTKRRR